MRNKAIQDFDIPIGSRIAYVVLFGLMVPVALIAIISYFLLLSFGTDEGLMRLISDTEPRFIYIGIGIVGLVSCFLLRHFLWWLLRSAIIGKIDERLVNRFGESAVLGWYGIVSSKPDSQD